MAETHEEIMEATRKALAKHSYSELSIQNISDEFDKSKSLLYHHYDGKDELLLEFLDYILEDFENKALSCECSEEGDKLETLAFMAFNLPRENDFLKTMVELRTQSIRHEKYREKFMKFEEAYKENLANTLKEGKKQGGFPEDLQPVETAEFISAINNEAMFRKAADQETSQLREELNIYLQERIF